LEWVAGPGWTPFFEKRQGDRFWFDAQEYRNRHLINALRGRTPVG
jgi:hypothetical protein